MSSPLGQMLRKSREDLGLHLRDVERATGIHNAHLSQIENGTIKRPEPHILWKLAAFYQLEYRSLLRLAGHVTPTDRPQRSVRAVAFQALDDLSPEEQRAVVDYMERLIRKRSEESDAR